ncbi:MAG: SH3 domain-containing protein [Oscillospiraceae bacterium]|nr:SH3 domain-containing protein [Oscillospiraceae bacterium]
MLHKRKTDVLHLASRLCTAALALGCLVSSCLAAPAAVSAEGGLRLRQQASTGAKVIATLSNGSKLDVVKAVDADWYQVTAGGKTGYVSRDYVRFTCTGTVNTSSLNLRSGPGTGHSKVATLSKGDRITVLSMEQDWYQVKADSKTGYVSMEYITIDGQPAQTDTPAQTAPATQTTQQAGKVNASSLNVRSGAGTGYGKVTSLTKGTSVTVLDEENGWYRITAGGKTGYVSKQYITLTDSPVPAQPEPAPQPSDTAAPGTDTQAERFGKVNASSLNVRSGPGSSHARVKTLSSGTLVSITGEENGWYHITVGDETGYVSKQYITLVEDAPQSTQPSDEPTPAPAPDSPTDNQQTGDSQQAGDSKTYGIVSTGSLNIRSGPGSSYDKVGSLSSGKQVELLEKLDGWYRIAEGYVSADYITVVDGSTSALRAQIVAYSRQFLGHPYVLGGKGPNSFDCSGLVWYVYKHFGYTINRSATQQLKNGVTITKDALQPGDLVFFNSAGTGVNRATHVGIYIGDGQFLHASSSKVGVVISDLYSAYYKKVYTTARRIL